MKKYLCRFYKEENDFVEVEALSVFDAVKNFSSDHYENRFNQENYEDIIEVKDDALYCVKVEHEPSFNAFVYGLIPKAKEL